MKKLILSIFIIMFLTSFSYSQEQDNFISTDTTFERQCNDWNFTNVIFIDSTITKDRVFQKVRQWFSESFVSSKNVLDNADKDEGILYGHVTVYLSKEDDGYVSFNIEIRCKNGKAKYLLNNYMHKDARQVNVYGYSVPASTTYTIGPLSQKEFPSSLGYSATGRGKKGNDKMFDRVKNQSKGVSYNLIQSLKSSLNKESIKEKDSW